MGLATVDVLTSEEIQLLADCYEPVHLLEKPQAAKRLILLGYLCMYTTTWQYSSRTCLVLTVRESGRSYVETWIAQHEALPPTRLTLVPSITSKSRLSRPEDVHPKPRIRK